MPFFVFVCLAVIACSFLIMLAVQIIRMEKRSLKSAKLPSPWLKNSMEIPDYFTFSGSYCNSPNMAST